MRTSRSACLNVGLPAATALSLLLGACASNHSRVSGPQDRTGDAAAPDGRLLTQQEPLVIGESLMIDSQVLGEPRRVNVFIPTVYGQPVDEPLPVLYMPDGGLDEDFLHVAGLVQVLVSNGGMRPFMLVGIQNTQRRRDLCGPTSNAEDLAAAPGAGGSGAFRRFIRQELMPTVRGRYRTTAEAAIVGESLAGLFAMETLFEDPELFSAYICFDPSLWWNSEHLVKEADARLNALPAHPERRTSVFIASGDDPETARLASQMAKVLSAHSATGVDCRYAAFPGESHATIYHPAALLAFRTVFAPGSPPSR